MNQIYIANLGKYVEGELVGEWFEFPIDMKKVGSIIGLNARYEEIAIHDYETVYPIQINEYSNIETLNKTIETLDNIEGLKELCETLQNDSKYDVNNWGYDLMNILNELDYDHSIVDDEWIEEYLKTSERGWQGVRIFLHNADALAEIHLLDGYGNLEKLHYSDAEGMLKDAIKKLID